MHNSNNTVIITQFLLCPLTHDTCILHNSMHEKSCVLKALWTSVNQHLNQQTINNQSVFGHSIDTWLTSWLNLDRCSVDSQPSVERLVCIDGKLVDSWPRCQLSIDQVSTKMPMKSRSRVLIKGTNGLLTAIVFSTCINDAAWKLYIQGKYMVKKVKSALVQATPLSDLLCQIIHVTIHWTL